MTNEQELIFQVIYNELGQLEEVIQKVKNTLGHIAEESKEPHIRDKAVLTLLDINNLLGYDET